jgi:hypothetical protein
MESDGIRCTTRQRESKIEQEAATALRDKNEIGGCWKSWIDVAILPSDLRNIHNVF